MYTDRTWSEQHVLHGNSAEVEIEVVEKSFRFEGHKVGTVVQ